MATDAGHPDIPARPLKWYRELSQNNGRLAAGAFLVDGEKAIRQIMGYLPDTILEVLTTKPLAADFAPFNQRLLEPKQFKSIVPSVSPQGMAAVIKLPDGVYGNSLPEFPGEKILLLEDIQDPGNIGTLMRTASALGFAGAILSEKCADPFSPKSVQASAGAILSLWIRRNGDYLDMALTLKGCGFKLIATVLSAAPDVDVLRRNSRIVLELGNESAGLSSALLDVSDYRLGLPIASKKAESLNVAACGAICMYIAGSSAVATSD